MGIFSWLGVIVFGLAGLAMVIGAGSMVAASGTNDGSSSQNGDSGESAASRRSNNANKSEDAPSEHSQSRLRHARNGVLFLLAGLVSAYGFWFSLGWVNYAQTESGPSYARADVEECSRNLLRLGMTWSCRVHLTPVSGSADRNSSVWSDPVRSFGNSEFEPSDVGKSIPMTLPAVDRDGAKATEPSSFNPGDLERIGPDKPEPEGVTWIAMLCAFVVIASIPTTLWQFFMSLRPGQNTHESKI